MLFSSLLLIVLIPLNELFLVQPFGAWSLSCPPLKRFLAPAYKVCESQFTAKVLDMYLTVSMVTVLR